MSALWLIFIWFVENSKRKMLWFPLMFCLSLLIFGFSFFLLFSLLLYSPLHSHHFYVRLYNYKHCENYSVTTWIIFFFLFISFCFLVRVQVFAQHCNLTLCLTLQNLYLFFFSSFQISPFLHSAVRGICGDFNGENFQEAKDPKCRRIFQNKGEFLAAYKVQIPFYQKRDILLNPGVFDFIKTKKCPRDSFFAKFTGN